MSAESWGLVLVLGALGLGNLLVGAAWAGLPSSERTPGDGLCPLGVGLWAWAGLSLLLDPGPGTLSPLLGHVGAALAMVGAFLEFTASAKWTRRGLGLIASLLVGGLLAGPGAPLAPMSSILTVAAFWLAVLSVGVALFKAARGERGPRTRWRLASALVVALAAVSAAALGSFMPGGWLDLPLFLVAWAELLVAEQLWRWPVGAPRLLPRILGHGVLVSAVLAALTVGPRLVGLTVVPSDVVLLGAVSVGVAALFLDVGPKLIGAIDARLSLGRGPFPPSVGPEGLEALRRRLARAERLAIAGELAASVAHEIKNPLAPIKGYAQMLQKRLEAVSEAERPFFEKALGVVVSESERIEVRIQALLAAAKGEGQGAPASSATAALAKVLEDVVALGRGDPGIRQIELQIDPGIDRVRGDEDELRAVLLNLLVNAAEAQPDRGVTIEISAERLGDRVVIALADDGPGLDPVSAERAFEPFYTTKVGGTGLGLVIARSAVQAAGGTLVLSNRSPGRGVVARLELRIPQG